MSLLKKLFGPSREEIWRQLSQEIGGQFLEGNTWKGGKVIAKTGEWTVTLDTFRIDTQYDHIVYTRLRAPYLNKDGFRFRIYRKGLFTAIEKLFGLQDVVVGYPLFDRDFVIQGNSEEKLKALFSNAWIRDWIEEQPSILLEVRDDEGCFRDAFPEGVDELVCLLEDPVMNLDQLKSLFDLFSETLNHLCHIGSAYENDPRLELM
ncbi:MAG TPA: DUF3137 domain-containing protein [bacterium]|nr:DUF3137 domain-containing protein [bacterium]